MRRAMFAMMITKTTTKTTATAGFFGVRTI
jgi:hypothetical protein